LTCFDGKCAIEEIRNPPAYRKPETVKPDDVNIKFEADGTMRIRSEDKIVHLFETQKSARMNTHIEYDINPEGKVVKQKDIYNRVVQYPPDSMTLILPKLRTMWTLGRGFSGYLKKVTEVTPVEGGLLRVKAEGVSMVQGKGKWTLTVDPK